MAEETPAVNLNKEWLQKFLDNDVLPFLAAVKSIRENGNSPGGLYVPGMSTLQGGADGAKTAPGFLDGQKVPLAIGAMAGDAEGRTNGGYLVKSLNGMVDQLDEILKLQVDLFEEIGEDLKDTIAKMFKTQDDNLEKIDGKKLVDFFEGVDEVLSESGGGSSGNKDD
ncbi:type VII secretion system-associated protein [Streptomyces sp. NRRL WC-3549]|uniref:type VII secretion system-associated protein n=1 Tax=Streptomyces sp. NRRL WC-3549 TaxID=1463925 RepID=UPI0004CAF63E|nr:type VII secretion system-associated protein [Streptomyces sp. NRRL WC-3549]